MSYYNNPFLNMAQPMQTPQQYQQELNQQMQRYNQVYQQAQQSNINANASNLNGYDGYIKYVANYNDVENAQVPMNGTPVLFISSDGSIAWCKKFLNGQNYCDVYNLSKSTNKPISNEQPINNQPTQENQINAILQAFGDRLAKIEDKLNISKGANTNE